VLAADPALRRGPGESGSPVQSSNRGWSLGPGDVLTEAGCELQVVASPGHTGDSVCLLLPADGALLTGDTVLGRGTTVIAGDGNLADYLATLDRLRALADERQLSTLLPGHGPLLADPAGVLDFTSRIAGSGSPRSAPRSRPGTGPARRSSARVYADVDRGLWPFARWSVKAQLDYLDGLGNCPPESAP